MAPVTLYGANYLANTVTMVNYAMWLKVQIEGQLVLSSAYSLSHHYAYPLYDLSYFFLLHKLL